MVDMGAAVHSIQQMKIDGSARQKDEPGIHKKTTLNVDRYNMQRQIVLLQTLFVFIFGIEKADVVSDNLG